MKYLLVIIFLLTSFAVNGQSKCGSCETDSIATNSVSCDTTILKNNSKLYYQLNCDSIWLTLENADKVKKVIFSLEADLAGYNYRLGFQLTKEFDSRILFRYGCPANGPCRYVLSDKNTGAKLKDFFELIYKADHPTADFLVYFSNDKLKTVTLYYVETGKAYNIPIKSRHFKAIIPEHQFEDASLSNNLLILPYIYYAGRKQKTKEIILDLSVYNQ